MSQVQFHPVISFNVELPFSSHDLSTAQEWVYSLLGQSKLSFLNMFSFAPASDVGMASAELLGMFSTLEWDDSLFQN